MGKVVGARAVGRVLPILGPRAGGCLAVVEARMRRLVSRLMMQGAWALAIAAAVAGCGPNARLDFLQSRPENALVYPGASLVSAGTNTGVLPDAGPEIDRAFSAASPQADVVDWYRVELSKRNWVGGVASSGQGTEYTAEYGWSRPGLTLELEFFAPVDGRTKFVVVMQAGSEYVVAPQLEALRQMPEATLAPEGARPSGLRDDWLADPTPAMGGWQLRVSRMYILDTSASGVEAFYRAQLAARGWAPATPLPFGRDRGAPDLQWQQGTVTIRLSIADSYRLELDQTVNAAETPVTP